MDAAIGEDAVVLERTIDVHIKSLRKKLGDAADLIETVRGVGHRFHACPGWLRPDVGRRAVGCEAHRGVTRRSGAVTAVPFGKHLGRDNSDLARCFDA